MQTAVTLRGRIGNVPKKSLAILTLRGILGRMHIHIQREVLVVPNQTLAALAQTEFLDIPRRSQMRHQDLPWNPRNHMQTAVMLRGRRGNFPKQSLSILTLRGIPGRMRIHIQREDLFVRNQSLAALAQTEFLDIPRRSQMHHQDLPWSPRNHMQTAVTLRGRIADIPK